MRRLKGKNIDR